MEKHLAKVVNMGLTGEPQNICLQLVETLKVFPFSKIKLVSQNDELRATEIPDGEYLHADIVHVINNMGHVVEITFDENDEVTLYF
jgi:hypothetical protein